MGINLLVVELTFTDFALLAVLLILMYLLTLLEMLVPSGTQSLAGVELINRKRAATWSFAGILLTLVAGVASQETRDDLFWLTIPVVAITHWAYFHWLNSKVLDVQVVLTHVKEAHRSAIVAVFAHEPGGHSVQALLDRVLQTDVYTRALSLGGPLLRTVVPLPLGDLLNRLLPTQSRTEEVLQTLQDEGLIARDGDLYYRRSAHPVALASAQPRQGG